MQWYSLENNINVFDPIQLSMFPPSVTLVTSCFDLTRFNGGCRSIDEFKESFDILLSLPCYLVIFGDSATIPILKTRRSGFGLDDMTLYIQREYENLETTVYLDKVRENREHYWPTRDSRTCAESHLLCCAKFFFLKEAMAINPFGHDRFGWIDSNLKLPNNSQHIKICENYRPEKILRAIDFTKADKFHIHVINVLDKRFKNPGKKYEMYSKYQWVMAGCFFTFGKDIGARIIDRLLEIFHQTTMAGYGHAEEMFFLEILDEFFGDIHRSYGDYGQIINNYELPTENIHYIFHLILKQYSQFEYNREVLDCAGALVESAKRFMITIPYDQYMEILIMWYVASYGVSGGDDYLAATTAQEIVSMCECNPLLKAEFMVRNDYYVAILGLDPKFVG